MSEWKNLGGEIMASLEAAGHQAGQPVRIKWAFCCEDEEAAWALASELEPEGYGCLVDAGEDPDRDGAAMWICHARKLLVPEAHKLNALGERLERMAKRCRCCFDAWDLTAPNAGDACPSVRALAGAQLYMSGEYRAAILALGEIYGRDHELDSEIVGFLGLAYLRLDRWQRAERIFQDALDLQPNQAEHLCNLGIAIKEQGRLDEALGLFQKVVELQDNHGEGYYNVACVRAVQGDVEAALASLRRAIECDRQFRKMVLNDRDFTQLRDNPEFQALTGRSLAGPTILTGSAVLAAGVALAYWAL